MTNSAPQSAYLPASQGYSGFSVVGAGAWGTALALIAAANGKKVTLWAYDNAAEIARDRENTRYLPGFPLPETIRVTEDLAEAAAAPALLLVSPAQHLRQVLKDIAPNLAEGTPAVICAKGIETGTGLLLHEVLAKTAPKAVPSFLSGPSFARDVAAGLPTAVVIAAAPDIALRLQASLGAVPFFRPYVSEDITGVAFGGAAKNVYAIACGMVQGARLGENARAALLARSFAELLRLSAALGARAETLMGLSGLGDLVLTATSTRSRNFALGVALGEGTPLAKLQTGALTEGVATAPALLALAQRNSVELPIAGALADVLAGSTDVAGAVEQLLSRPYGAE